MLWWVSTHRLVLRPGGDWLAQDTHTLEWMAGWRPGRPPLFSLLNLCLSVSVRMCFAFVSFFPLVRRSRLYSDDYLDPNVHKSQSAFSYFFYRSAEARGSVGRSVGLLLTISHGITPSLTLTSPSCEGRSITLLDEVCGIDGEEKNLQTDGQRPKRRSLGQKNPHTHNVWQKEGKK